MKFSITNFLNRFDQIRSFLQVWSHLLEKCVKENFLYSFCGVLGDSEERCSYKIALRVFLKKLFVSILKLSRNFTTCHQLNIIRQRGLLWLNLLKFILMKILKSRNPFRGNLYIKSYFLEFEDYLLKILQNSYSYANSTIFGIWYGLTHKIKVKSSRSALIVIYYDYYNQGTILMIINW